MLDSPICILYPSIPIGIIVFKIKITRKGNYALKDVPDLVLRYNIEPVTGPDIAKRIDAPAKFPEQVVRYLKKGGVIESRRGNVGGYRLSKLAGEINIGDVVRLIDGVIEPISCIKNKYLNCADISRCIFGNLAKGFQGYFRYN